MKPRVLITGATGYIGSHTIVELVRAGYDVVGIDNFSNSSPQVLEGIKKIIGKDIDFLELDCSDYNSLKKVFDKYPSIEASVHFAASKAVGESVENPLLYYRNNINALLNLLELSTLNGKKSKIVFSSSCTVYGQPTKENLPITENTPLQPATSPYGRTKQMSEDILIDSVKAYDKLNVTALRYFNPIGAHPTAYIGELPNGVPQNLVPYITQTAAGKREYLSVFGNDYNTPDGSCIRDYIYVVDLAKAHVKALDRLFEKGVRFEIFNLGTSKGLSVLELINEFTAATGINIKYKIAARRSGDVEQVWANPSKANIELGWRADTPIREVLMSAWKWQNMLDNKEE